MPKPHTPAQIATPRCLAGERGAPDSLATLEELAKEAIFALCCCGSGAAWGPRRWCMERRGMGRARDKAR